MKYLLDTHVLIWFAEDNKKLSKDFKDIILNLNNYCSDEGRKVCFIVC